MILETVHHPCSDNEANNSQINQSNNYQLNKKQTFIFEKQRPRFESHEGSDIGSDEEASLFIAEKHSK